MDEAVSKRLEKEYKRTAKELEKEIASYFQRYGKDNVIEFRTMMQDLPKADRDLLFKDMEAFALKYPEHADKLPVRESIYKLNRLQGLHYSTEMKLLELGAIEQQELEKHLEKTYGKRYAEMMHELGIGHSFLAVNDEVMKSTLYARWVNGGNFSDRIWDNKQRLLEQLRTRYRDGLARGDNYSKLTKEIIERLDVGSSDARRLVWTEASFVLNQAHTHAYQNAGVEEYEISAIMDHKTSPICREMDGKVFRFDEMEVGTNFPPFHPYCRTTFIGVLEERDEEREILRFESPEEVKTWVGDYEVEYIKALTNDERDAVKDYTLVGYSGVNRYLRGKSEASPEDLRLIEELDKAISKFTLKDDILVYRNVGRDALPPYGFDIMDLVGKEYNDKAFMSTSVLKDGAFSRYDVMLEITVPKGKGNGAYINGLSTFKDEEYEFLIKRDATFKIKEVEPGRVTTVRMEMVTGE